MPTFTLADLAASLKGELSGDPELLISGTAEIDKAKEGQITFLANPKYKPYLESTGATAVIIDDKAGDLSGIPAIKVSDAYFGFLQVFMMFYTPKKMLDDGIHPTAVIHESAEVGDGSAIGANVYIGANVKIGKGCQIFPNCVVLDDTTIGSDCKFYPSVNIREVCTIGDRVILHNGVVVGSDGFGFAPYQGKFHKIPQVGTVIIEDDVEIGANTTIDRATMGETRIKSGVKLDNLIHIAHNVVVGDDTVIAAQTGVSGSTTIGKHAMIGGQVGMVGHIHIGDRVQIAAQSGVVKNVPEGEVLFGSPARPIMVNKRIEAATKNLPDLLKRVRAIEKKLDELTQEGFDGR